MTTAAGNSMSGSSAICSWVVNITPNTLIMMTASSVVTLCWMLNFAVLIRCQSSPSTIRTGVPSSR